MRNNNLQNKSPGVFLESKWENKNANGGRNLPKKIIYTSTILESFDRERHIEVSAAYGLVERAGLSVKKLKEVINAGKIYVYYIKGKRYIDRVDIGRIFHVRKKNKEGLTIRRYFTDGKKNPFDSVEYEVKNLSIKNYKTGEVIFSMQAEFPAGWSSTAASIVAQKYFYKPNSQKCKEKVIAKIGREYEFSPRHLINRVTNFIAESGWRLGYFKTEDDKDVFADELKFLQINKMFAFNSPVQFNAGLYSEYGVVGSPGKNYWKDPQNGEVRAISRGEYIRPQCHACFIKGPNDDLKSILNHTIDEGSVFSSGSGIGHDIGTLRGMGEPLSGGGKASGPMSFFKVYDIGAGTIKSGGKSRRAARMTTMRYQHPDILEFIRCKVKEDKKALVLIKNGYSPGMDGEAYTTVAFQNTNISVRLDSDFFHKVENGGKVELKRVSDGKVVDKIPADMLLKEISFGSWRVGDPGVQYETPIQKMHTCKNSGRINSSNPCSEYMFLNDTSCNLASTNLVAFSNDRGIFNFKHFNVANRLIAIAQDIINNAASYPISGIADVSPEFRTIGLGYANLGALLMRKGIAYDSDEGRNFAAVITALMTGEAYVASAEMADKIEPFIHYEFNEKPMSRVMKLHQESLDQINWEGIPSELKESTYDVWKSVLENGKKFGYRNAQTTVLAPTGTISYLMDCDTTGVEPAVALQIHKELAGGGNITLVNNEVRNALKNLDYNPDEVDNISQFIEKHNSVTGAPGLDINHYNIFSTALGNVHGEGAISFEGHVKMLGVLQPFISGAISKTNNLPESATVKDISDGFMLGHKLGVKALSIFRNNSKPISALSFVGRSHEELKRGEKKELPKKRSGIIREVKFGGTSFHVITGEYDDGTLGELRLEAYKAGSTMAAMLKGIGIDTSTALKRGVHLKDMLDKNIGQVFEPRGYTDHEYIQTTSSIRDFVFRLLAIEYLGRTEYATSPELVDIRTTRGYENGAFKVYAMEDVDDWNIDHVIDHPELGGYTKQQAVLTNFEPKLPQKHLGSFVQPPVKEMEGSQSRGIPCTGCGNLMMQTAPNCFSCKNCGEKVGGCGL